MRRATGFLLAAALTFWGVMASGLAGQSINAELTLSAVADTLDQVLRTVQEHHEEAARIFAASHPHSAVGAALASRRGDRRRLLTVAPSVQQFLTGVLGSAWRDSLPAAWSSPAFDWARLGDFEYTSSLSDFLDAASLRNLTAVRSLRQLALAVHSMEDAFCSAEKFTPAVAVPSSCAGPMVTLAVVPKSCVLDGQAKQVVCTPAKLVLRKTPGLCTPKYDAALSWVGEVCKLSGTVGHNDSRIAGGMHKAIPLAHVDLPGPR